MVAFENWSTSPRSAVERDASLTFESQILKDAHAVWSGLAAGAIPPRDSLTLRVARAFMGNIVLFERQDGGGYLVRLMGTRVSTVLGEMQGKRLDAAIPAAVAGRWTLALDEALAAGAPRRIVNRVDFDNLDYLQAEIFLAPLLDGQGRPTMVLAVLVFRSGVAAGRAADAIVADQRGVIRTPREDTDR